MNYQLQPSYNTSASYLLLKETITSNKEMPKRSNTIKIKLLNRRFEPNKASVSSRFEGKPSISNNASTFICTEEFVEDSSTSKDEENSEHAHDNIESINNKYEHTWKMCNKSFEPERALSGRKRIHSDKVVKKEVSNKSHNDSHVLSNLPDNDLEWKNQGKRSQKRECVDDIDDAMIIAAETLLYLSGVIHMEAESTNNGSAKAGELQLGGDHGNILETDQNKNIDSKIMNPGPHEKASEMQIGGDDAIIMASANSCEDRITIQFKEVLESDLRVSVVNDDEIMENASTKNALEPAVCGKENVGSSSNQEKEMSKLGNDLSLGILGENAHRKRIKLESDATDALRAYVCQICNKSFSSHQALGGHTVSHNKGKNKQGEARSKMSEHKCKICGKVYETGQSLGGHMRKHYNPDKRKSLDIGLTLLTIKEDNRESSDKLCSSNAMEESEQLLAVDEDKGKQGMGESSSENAMEETDETQAIKEDPGKDVGESSSATNPTEETNQHSTWHGFDLNELPDYED